MILNELIEELLKLQQEGRGEYEIDLIDPFNNDVDIYVEEKMKLILIRSI
jgi:hypothetical protein